MKKHILALAGLLAGAMMVTSCSQARLDEVEHLGVTEVDKTYAEADDMTAQQLIANVYVTAKYLMMGDWGVHYIATTSAKTAECWPGGSGPNDGTDYHRMSAMIDDSENNAYKEMYTRFYKIMYKCNMIVDKLNDGSDERKRVIAEAKAWRAWAMMRLTQLWGSAPLVDHVLDGINYSFYPGNSNPADNWKWIMTQFDEAATVLPSKSGLGGQKAIGGRWTAEACFAYKGQGYMWQNDYANAKVELAKVINSGKYELWEKTATMGPSSYGTNMQLAKSQNENWSDGNEEYEYLTLYRAEADFCDEFLLELDIDGDATTITSTEPYWFRAYMNWRKDEVNLPGNTTTASDGWGFVNPTRTFGYAFAKHDGNSVRRRAAIATYSEVYHDFPYLNKDVRGVMSSMLFENEGYFRMKYYDFVDDVVPERFASGQTNGNTTNFPLMRYADVLLMYAEAINEYAGAPDDQAKDAIREIRKRAGVKTDESLLGDYRSFRDLVRNERGRELAFEGLRKWDLIRWGTFVEKMHNAGTNQPTENKYRNVSYTNYASANYANVTARHIYLPIPTKELAVNHALRQNPLW